MLFLLGWPCIVEVTENMLRKQLVKGLHLVRRWILALEINKDVRYSIKKLSQHIDAPLLNTSKLIKHFTWNIWALNEVNVCIWRASHDQLIAFHLY
ncbi:hypothetical protein R6Q59_012271 [Mikania micrantha]